MKYDGVQWKGVTRQYARKLTKRLARKQERQAEKKNANIGYNPLI